MSKRRQTGEQKSFKPTFLKEAWLLVENVNGDGDRRRFEVICVEPKVAHEEGHLIGPYNWLYIQPDGEGTPRLVLTRDLSRGREVMERLRRMLERDRTEWTTKEKEPERKNNKMTICTSSRHSIRKAKREMRRNATKREMKCMRKSAVSDFVLAKRRRSDWTRQFDGAVPSCSGVPRQVYTPSPPLPPSTPPQNITEESYSSEVASASSSSTDEEEKFRRLVKSIAKYSGQFSKRSRSMHSSRCSSQRGYQHHRRRLMMSTPNPTSMQNVIKLTFDQGTQTDPIDDQPSLDEDPEVEEGRAALIQMGTLIQTITNQFNCLTQSMGLEGMTIEYSDMETEDEIEEEEGNEEEVEDEEAEEELGEEEEQDSETDSDTQSNQSSENPSLLPEEVLPQPENVDQELVDVPEPIQRVSPVQAVASPSVRVPTPQQPVVGSVERADREGQSSNESGEHFVTTSNIAGPGPSGKRMAKVRRVSAHTTNRIDRGPGEDLVPIGNGHAMVPSRLLEEIDWNSYTQATRQLLQAVFPRRVLATHSLTGKRSPAFLDKPPKKRLDPQLVEDVVIVVTLRCGVTERLVRNCITIKCTDEAKLYRNRQLCRQGLLQGSDQENVPPNHATDEATEMSSGDS